MSWITPKTDWTPVDGIADTDLNRIEGNILESYSGNTLENSIVGTISGFDGGAQAYTYYYAKKTYPSGRIKVSLFLPYRIGTMTSGSVITIGNFPNSLKPNNNDVIVVFTSYSSIVAGALIPCDSSVEIEIAPAVISSSKVIFNGSPFASGVRGLCDTLLEYTILPTVTTTTTAGA